MLKPYRPSNGTEGVDFMERWCFRCKRDAAFQADHDAEGCPILSDSFIKEVPEWVYDPETYFKTGEGEGAPRCTAFEPKEPAK